MTSCPVCALRYPGEDLCPMHPQASASHDLLHEQAKMNQQVNQLDDICAWITLHRNPATPQHTTHILATICDKCGTQVTVNLCDTCAGEWGLNASQSRCGNCGGKISWQLHNIQTGIHLEQINPSEL